MSKTAVDYIVVGQGLAGSCLAFQILRQGKTVLVIDNPSRNRCSSVAAGLFNPVTGQNLVKTWLSDSIFPYLFKFYREVESVSGARFFHTLHLYRPFGAAEEQNEWMGRSTDPVYQKILESISLEHCISGVKDPLGGLLLNQCGFIDTMTFISAVRTMVSSRDTYLADDFRPEELMLVKEGAEYQRWRARRVVFCQGVDTKSNPWFSNIPVRRLKGETLTIKTAWPGQVILNRGVYMVPGLQPGAWRVGATYNLKDYTDHVTPEGRMELKSKLDALVDFNYEIAEQNWGVRPTTTDRRPLMGMHPKHEQLWVFNGLGTKGVSLAPYFSEVLLQSIESGIPLNKEVDVTRFKVLY